MSEPVKIFGYKKLFLYKKAKELVLTIYKATANFPKTEAYNLTSQMRRAVISVLANIIEGYSKESPSEYARFLTISIGSITEPEVCLDISYELGYIKRVELLNITGLLEENKRLLYGSRKAARLKRDMQG